MAEPSPLDAVDYALPPERIAQSPAARREDARMLVAARADAGDDPAGGVIHAHVRDLPNWLRAGDLLVVNATRVLPARLRGHKHSGGQVEALLLGPDERGAAAGTHGSTDATAPAGGAGSARFRALLRSNGRVRPELALCFEGPNGARAEARVVEVGEHGEVTLAFDPDAGSPYDLGEAPLPPYIRRDPGDTRTEDDRERYQTVYARVPGAVAAPTAGLHLSNEILAALATRGVERAEVVLHVGIGTFRPPRPEDLAAGRLHSERYVLPQNTAEQIARTRRDGGRVVAIGTTSARVLETCALDDGTVEAGEGETTLFLQPGARFRAVDALLTNFHLPRSSLLLLVAAFAGRDRVLAWYEEAIRRDYRFYSYGDAMLIL